MKLPNGYGSVTKLSGRRRRPYIVRKTIGFHLDPYGKTVQDFQIIGYARTRAEGLAMLADFNKMPLAADANKMTLEMVFKGWARKKYGDDTVPRHYVRSFEYCAPLHNTVFRMIRTPDIQQMVDAQTADSAKSLIKLLFHMLSDWAIVNDFAVKDYSAGVVVPPKHESDIHQAFTEEEISQLWKHADDRFIRGMLVLIYTGMRPAEMLGINPEDVHLEEGFMVGGVKTKAGRDRRIPIADKIMPLVRDFLAEGRAKAFALGSYENFRLQFTSRAKKLGMSHLLHDGRHTCATLLAKAKVDPLITKIILGHARTDITERVYTHVDVTQLREAVNRL